ncbi:GumC family protein [Leptolyngbya sp. 7M]|uniref:GumC family protein n=1 Tax=Leptolyngbya sp. 7M TaxID=2812896 RepID=UPI001B8D0E80|nr:polysaccharide biosynthesis tyrosine autokinase [Leptolyngbya sp. 7M]QYO66513.1 polysaccharide biosynthesis tyrosine autokinase [Leptolyngbya sp. 7M]
MKESREIIQRPIGETVEIERPFTPHLVAGSERYPAYRELNAQEGITFLDYWRAIRKRLWLVIGLAVLATTAAAIYVARKPDVYQAKAVIQVDLEQANPDLVTSDRQRPMSAPDPAYFNTQLQLLSSDTLLRRVIKDHNLDVNKEFLEARNESGISAWRSILRAVGLASGEKKDANSNSAAVGASTLASADEIAEAVRLAPYVTLIQQNLGVEPIRDPRTTFKDTRLIEVSFRHTDPELAAFVVNGIGESFTTYNQEKRSGTSRKTSDFLQQRIADLQTDIKNDEIRLVELKKSEGILKTEGENTLVLSQLSLLNRQLLEAENARKLAEAEYNAAVRSPESSRSLVEDKLARYITEQENSVRELRTDVEKKTAELRALRDQKLVVFQESAPEIKEIDRQIESLERSLAQALAKNRAELEEFRKRSSSVLTETLRTNLARAREAEDKIRATYNQKYNEAQGQNIGAVQIRLLEQNIETNKGFLDNLRKQQSSNDVASKGSDNNISVAAFAIPPEKPIGPQRLTTVLGVLFLSTLFGMGLALFLEYLDDTIKTTEEIENYLQLPALAAIPTIDSMPRRKLLLVGKNEGDEAADDLSSELLINADPRSSLAEAYRQLRTSILLSTAGHAPKSLLVTSSLPSEGKTTTATNTAISLAQTGAKVLIIDGDMRRPRLHSVFGIENGDGLSTVLSSEMTDKEILSLIKQDEGSKLNLLTSGPIPPNPAELIGSEQMVKLMSMLQEHFTHVVIDSPPITSFTDGVLIASMVDGVVLVVHSGKSSRQVVRRARQLLVDVGARIVGVVLNNVNLRSQDNYYYYQSYYHRDNYFHSDDRG